MQPQIKYDQSPLSQQYAGIPFQRRGQNHSLEQFKLKPTFAGNKLF
jgi:hypothetical protein